MPKISIDNAQPGMVVTEEVMNDKGMVLLPSGTILNEVLIARLKKWNVLTVVCQGEGSSVPGASKTEAFFEVPVMDAALEKHLEEKFKPVLDDPIMKDVYSAVKIYFSGLQKKEEAPKT